MLSENRLWGAIPDGFTKVTDSGGASLVVRQDRLGEIEISICRADPTARTAAATMDAVRFGLSVCETGKPRLFVIIDMADFSARLRALRFFTWPPRPFRELAITEELRRRGLRTVEVYAAGVQRLGGPFYRGCLVTRELRDAMDLWAALRDGSVGPQRLRAILKATADSISHMHREGVYHSDLNLKNILIRKNADCAEGYVIDFDKAKLFLGKLPPLLAKKNLDRLLRSALKLDPERRYLSSAVLDRVFRFLLWPLGRLDSTPKRILIVLHGSIGDVTRALPLAAMLRRAFPRAFLAWSVEPACFPLLQGNSAIDEIILLERQRWWKNAGPFLARVRAGHFDLVLDLQRLFKSGFISWWSGAAQRIGFHRQDCKEFNWVFNNLHIPPYGDGISKLEHYLKFADYLEIERSPLEWHFNLTVEEQASITGHLSKIGGSFAVLFVGTRWQSKQWFPVQISRVRRSITGRLRS